METIPLVWAQSLVSRGVERLLKMVFTSLSRKTKELEYLWASNYNLNIHFLSWIFLLMIITRAIDDQNTTYVFASKHTHIISNTCKREDK